MNKNLKAHNNAYKILRFSWVYEVHHPTLAFVTGDNETTPQSENIHSTKR